jgi:nucleolar complex protein 3
MVNHLFGLLLPLCMNPDLEKVSATLSSSSPSALILRAIQLCLVSPPIYSIPTERLASFVIRMLICCLHTPAKTALGLLQLTRILMSKKEELKGLLDNSDRAKNGQFDPSSDMLDGLRPLQSGYIPWQLQIIRSSCHEEIREQCDRILAL